jgi:hypothetical protein
MTNLGSAPGDGCGIAQQVNAKGQAVGPSFPCAVGPFNGRDDATLYDHGSAIDLNDFVLPGSDYHLTGDDSFINDRGEIAVAGMLLNGDFRIFLLVPCDDDHPGIEGCDYNMVDAEVANNAPSPQPPHAILPTMDSPARTINPSQNRLRQRYRVPGQRPELRY